MIENAITPRWIRLRVLPISKYPSGENAARHLLSLSVLPACKTTKTSLNLMNIIY